jgi:hypothetical protein
MPLFPSIAATLETRAWPSLAIRTVVMLPPLSGKGGLAVLLDGYVVARFFVACFYRSRRRLTLELGQEKSLLVRNVYGTDG